ncbi:hypothetical protein IE81DRAFT_325464 [Ceraceosorus guamensis]|uniref:CCDC174 alpha/beta GRSR domain-containing protein n=1 Tax=Ceraceosorus guamensis TaxID=1522189 RepID=A0A316VUG2_9BASI|nr:hypothetical protein IE81DRAFT_325464 [Ceraceosorus guamensis]PWN40528.1 hypothetical protein IE81DRAFT_325464 [Ceraceosorus guamensis]
MDLPTRLGPQRKKIKLNPASAHSASTPNATSPASSAASSRFTLEALQKVDHKPASSSCRRIDGAEKGQPSASSFLNLKADLAERQGRRERETREKSSNILPSHLLPSRSTLDRSHNKSSGNRTTSSWSNTPSAQLEAARLSLERKAKAYELLRKGKEGGVDEEEFRGGVVDWDLKRMRDEDEGREDEDEDEEAEGKRDENLASVGGEDPLIEYTDELGRSRMMRRSQVPRDWLREQERKTQEGNNGDDGQSYDDAIYAPQTDFPVYQRDPRTLPVTSSRNQRHFDASHEVRNRGAAFYAFDKDEDARQRQMRELQEERKKTESRRKSEDGEEVQLDEKGGVGRGVDQDELRREKRRREVEQKRKELEAKRKKTLSD